MSNETIYKTSTQTNVITGSAAIASNGFNLSTEVVACGTAQTGKYPLGDLALFASFTASVSSASNIVNVYRRDKNIDGGNNAPQPQSAAPAYSNIGVGSFVIPPFTAQSTGYFFLPDVPLGAGDMEFYIENKTNTGIASNYTLKLTPKTFAPAP
jgi:hypothetical protein